MTKEQLIEMGITAEIADKVIAANQEQLKGFIPKDRFDQVNNEKNDYKAQMLDRDKQLETLKKGAKDNEELTKKIEELQNANQTAKADYDKKIMDIQIDNAVDSALRNAKAKNTIAAKAFIDRSKLKLEGEKILGLDEQIKAITEGEETKFLFDVVNQQSTNKISGLIPAASNNPKDPNFKNPFSKEHFNLTEQGKLYKENRELAEQLSAQNQI